MTYKAFEQGKVFWITGLSGAGKTTLCRMLVDKMRAARIPVIMLDGDELREVMAAIDGHNRADRLRLAMSYARLCRLISSQGVHVAIATISMFREVHKWNRANLPGYYEIYLKVPVEELMRRDPKGIYSRYEAGEVCQVAGLDLPVDEPVAPDLLIEEAPEDRLYTIVDKLADLTIEG